MRRAIAPAADLVRFRVAPLEGMIVTTIIAMIAGTVVVMAIAAMIVGTAAATKTVARKTAVRRSHGARR